MLSLCKIIIFNSISKFKKFSNFLVDKPHLTCYTKQVLK